MAFWKPHVVSFADRETVVICNEPAFFRDTANKKVFRYLDINPEGTNGEQALRMLRDMGQEEVEGTYVSFQYLLSGEVAARDAIRKWFSRVIGIRIRFEISRRDVRLGECVPVLLGNPRTNRYMRDFFRYGGGKRLAYKPDEEEFGRFSIQTGNGEEEALKAYSDSASKEGGVYWIKDNPDKEVFVLVTRGRNAYEPDSWMTVISSYYTRAIEQTAVTLTKQERFKALGMKPEAMDNGFQMLLSVRLGTADMEAMAPECVCFRAYNI